MLELLCLVILAFVTLALVLAYIIGDAVGLPFFLFPMCLLILMLINMIIRFTLKRVKQPAQNPENAKN